MRPSPKRLALGLALCATACAVDPGSDRQGAEAVGIAIDSVRFLPIGSRFVLRDSASPIAFLGYHAGYRCSRFLELGLAEAPTGEPPAYRPATRIRLPGSDECALDSGGRDTTASHAFSAGALIRLADPRGRVTDSALLVRGSMGYDSIRGVPDSAGRAFTVGGVTYRDTSGSAPAALSADSLPACRYFNSAERRKLKGDTVEVAFSWVALDPAAAPDSCRGPAHGDSIPVGPRRKLRMGAL